MTVITVTIETVVLENGETGEERNTAPAVIVDEISTVIVTVASEAVKVWRTVYGIPSPSCIK